MASGSSALSDFRLGGLLFGFVAFSFSVLIRTGISGVGFCFFLGGCSRVGGGDDPLLVLEGSLDFAGALLLVGLRGRDPSSLMLIPIEDFSSISITRLVSVDTDDFRSSTDF